MIFWVNTVWPIHNRDHHLRFRVAEPPRIATLLGLSENDILVSGGIVCIEELLCFFCLESGNHWESLNVWITIIPKSTWSGFWFSVVIIYPEWRRAGEIGMSRLPESPESPESPNPESLSYLDIHIPIIPVCFFYKKWLAISLNTRRRSLFSACGGRRTGSTGTSHQPLMGWDEFTDEDHIEWFGWSYESYAICNIFLPTVTRHCKAKEQFFFKYVFQWWVSELKKTVIISCI